METFRVKAYEIDTDKLRANQRLRLAVLADLHGKVFGQENAQLLGELRRISPDAVLAAGDLTVNADLKAVRNSMRLLAGIAADFPVYYGLGNHEYVLMISERTARYYTWYEKILSGRGVRFLHNSSETAVLGGISVTFHGLELPRAYYRKPFPPRLRPKELDVFLGRPQEDGLHILLAHNPKYGDAYLRWGADLTVCGHFHGGVVRLDEHHGLISPQLALFPKYCCGDFHRGSCHMVVSAGLGEHTIPVRIHNPRELLVIDLKAPAAKRTTERK